MKHNIITVFEFEQLTSYYFDNPTDFDWLIKQNFPCFHIQRKSDHWLIKVRHYLGVITLPSGQILEILPKTEKNQNKQLTRQWIQQMLLETWQSMSPKVIPIISLQQFLPKINSQITLTDWIYQYFLQLLIRYQPNQHYQTIEQNQSFIQGKLLIKQQLQYNTHQPYKFFNQFQQFAKNTACNQFIKTTWLYLKNLQSSTNKAPQHLAQSWQQVDYIAYFLQNNFVIYSSNYQTYYQQCQQEIRHMTTLQQQTTKYLIDFCDWIWRTKQNIATIGQKPSFSLFINMQHAFECWVSQRIQQYFVKIDPHCRIYQQQLLPYLVDKQQQTILHIQPDIWVNCQQEIIVIDIKWKLLQSMSHIKPADIYQMMVYAEHLNANQVWLIYPKSEGLQQPTPLFHMTNQQRLIWLVPFCVHQQRLILPTYTEKNLEK